LSSTPPETTGHRINPWVVLTLVCMAQFMVVLDATVVNVALPSIAKSSAQNGLGLQLTDRQWVVNAYTLMFGGFLLLGGRAGDLFGRQKVFLTGLVIFTLASLFNGFTQSPTMLIIGRGVQGFGGALISPAALSIITTTFAEGTDRNKALGVWSGIAASGAAFGLIIGGALTQAISWRWAFFVNVPVGLITFMLSSRLVPESRVHGESGVDVGGAVAVTAGLVALVYAISSVGTPVAGSVTALNPQGTPQGWGSAPVLGWGAAGIVLLAAFWFIESRYRAPIVRLGIFAKRSLSMSNLAMFSVAGGMFAMFYFAGFYVQYILGYSPLKAGFAFLPVCVGIGVGAGIASQAVKRADVRAISCIGIFIAAGGYLLLDRIAVGSSYTTVVLPALVVMSVGMGLTFVPVTLIATTNVAAEDAGLASGLLNTSQQVGGSLGLAILATLAVDRTTSYVSGLHRAPLPIDLATAQVEGYRLAFVGGAIMLLVGTVFLGVFIRRSDVEGIAEASAGNVVEGIAEASA
jgi:EmrB/QacA subfamily drug resistance transporter